MKKTGLLLLILAFCHFYKESTAQNPDKNASLKLQAVIALPQVSGRIDHLAFDASHQRVFVAALGNNSVEVVDLVNKKHLHSIPGLDEPQGIAFIPETNHLVVANGGNGQCDVFDGDSFQKIKSIKLSSDADNVRYDPIGKKIYVGYGNGALAVLDALSYQIIADIPLSDHPESFQIDREAGKIYVNMPDKKLLEVIDIAQNKVTERWKMTTAFSNFPMSLDKARHRLFIGCRHPAMLVIMNSQTGKVISSLAVDNDVDDVFYNPSSGQIYLSCGAGFLDIIQQKDSDTYTAIQKIATRPGARTSLFIADLNLYIVAAPSGLANKASLLIYSVK